jgi:hypothetical protein
MGAYDNILNIAVVQLTGDKTNRYSQQDISKSVNCFTFCSNISMQEDVTVEELYLVLPLFMLMGIAQSLTVYHTTHRTKPGAIHSIH